MKKNQQTTKSPNQNMKYLISLGVFSGIFVKLRSGDNQTNKIICKESTAFTSPIFLVDKVKIF